MRNNQSPTVTALVQEFNKGHKKACDELFSLVYNQLKKVAHNLKYKQPGYETINTTALVHESYIKLLNNKNLKLESRSHFFSLVAKAMRHILVDYSRKKLAYKRNGTSTLTPEIDIEMSSELAEDIEILEKALKKLERVNKTIANVVECRIFSGMKIKETAEALKISESTVKRNWAMGKIWLYKEMQKQQNPKPIKAEFGDGYH